jgi:hypothetical protein
MRILKISSIIIGIVFLTSVLILVPKEALAQPACAPASGRPEGCPCTNWGSYGGSCAADLFCGTPPNGGVIPPNGACLNIANLQKNYGLPANWEPSTANEVFQAKTNVPDVIEGAAYQFSAPGKGLLAQGMRYITMMYTPPATTAEYVAQVKKNIGVTPAYAQSSGFGFQSISPIYELWKISRDIALAFFVVVFVFIGILVIMRRRIDPRTVISVQQAIPKIIIALVMVVFSYAILGFLIDVVTVATRLGAITLQNSGFIAQTAGPGGQIATPGINDLSLTKLLNANLFHLYSQLQDVDTLIASFANLDDQLGLVASVLQFDAAGGGGLTRLIIFIAIFVSMLRTFFVLLTSYLTVTISIIISPFQFFMYSLPGQDGGFETWFRRIMSHLLVFPTVFFMLAFAAIFYSQQGNTVWYNNGEPPEQNYWRTGREPFAANSQYWVAPSLGNWGTVVGPLLTLAILLTTPRAAGIVKGAINPKERPGSGEGAAGESIAKAAQKVPLVGSLTRF